MKLFFREGFEIADYTAFESREKEKGKESKEDENKNESSPKKRKLIGIPILAREASEEFNKRETIKKLKIRAPKTPKK